MTTVARSVAMTTVQVTPATPTVDRSLTMDKKNDRGFSWKQAHHRLKKSIGADAVALGENASDELAESMGWTKDKDPVPEETLPPETD